MLSFRTRSNQVLGLPVGLSAALCGFLLLPRVGRSALLTASFTGASASLVALAALVAYAVHAKRRQLELDVSIRRQHWVQALAHASVFVYWGFYWQPIVDAAPLIAAQVVFAYAFDMLLVWSHRDRYTLGFGPFPVIFSTNLFLRFRDDWFWLQFAMIAAGFLAKEFIRWRRDGRDVHVFNPSSFPLALFSIGLLLTGTTYRTWGEDIATQLFLPPHIYEYIFLISLPGQLLFGVTTMTASAVVTTYLISVAWFRVTGTYLFIDSNIPIGVFLGMHLLFTDPSTSPRTDGGRTLFGICYGGSVAVLYIVLGWCGAPRFYDKLLQVPIMNLAVGWFDRAAESRAMRWISPDRWAAALRPARRNLAYVAVWIVVFGALLAARGVGDDHPGHTVLFWVHACEQHKHDGCANLADLERRFCSTGSAWACNELRGGSRHEDPAPADYLQLLSVEKRPLPPGASPAAVLQRACDEGWAAGCGDLAMMYFLGRSVPQDKLPAVTLLRQACDEGHAASCSNLSVMFRDGDGVQADRAEALRLLRRACELGMSDACRWLADQLQ